MNFSKKYDVAPELLRSDLTELFNRLVDNGLLQIARLRRQGVVSVVRIGARKISRELEAHAWVESGARARNEPCEPRDRYAAFDAAFPMLSRKKAHC